MVGGRISNFVKTYNYNIAYYVLFGCLDSFYNEQETEILVEYRWATRNGEQVGSSYYETVVFDNEEDGGAWKNYIGTLPGGEIPSVPANAYYLEILVGFGRGDIGIDADGYLWWWRLELM